LEMFGHFLVVLWRFSVAGCVGERSCISAEWYSFAY